MAAALRSGVPQIPCPVMLDQPHNAKSILSLGCGLSAVPFAKLSAKKIVGELQKVFMNDKGVKTTAAKVGERIRAESERSLNIYCDVIDSYTKRGDFVYSHSATTAAAEGDIDGRCVSY